MFSSMLHGIHDGRRMYRYIEKCSGKKCQDLAIVCALEDRVGATVHRCVPCQWFDQSRQFYFSQMWSCPLEGRFSADIKVLAVPSPCLQMVSKCAQSLRGVRLHAKHRVARGCWVTQST
jgi:hypothetical protein